VERKLLQRDAREAEIREGRGKRMSAVNLVWPVGSNDKQMGQFRTCEQCRDHMKRGRIGPLQVVQEEHHGMRLARESTDKSLDGERHTVLSLNETRGQYGRLRSDNRRKLGDEFDEKARVRAETRENAIAETS
jgi:hypothetical protein